MMTLMIENEIGDEIGDSISFITLAFPALF